MPSFAPRYLRALPVDMSLLRQIENLAYARGTQRLFQAQTPALLKHLTTIAQVESTESSTRLEGAVAPRARIEGIALKDTAPINRSEAEIAGYRELEERIDAVRRGPGGTKTEMVRTAVARRVAPFRISDIERELPSVSRELIRNVLKDLRGEGVLVLRGRGRGARYEPVAR